MNPTGGTPLRQLSITECLKYAKMNNYKFKDSKIVSPVIIELDSDSDEDTPPPIVHLSSERKVNLDLVKNEPKVPSTPEKPKQMIGVYLPGSTSARGSPQKCFEQNSLQSQVILQSAAAYNTNFDTSTLQVLPKVNVSSKEQLIMNYAEDSTSQCALDSFPTYNDQQVGKISICKNLFDNNKHVTNSSTENKKAKTVRKPKKKLEQEKSSDAGKESKTSSNRKRKSLNKNDASSPSITIGMIDSPLSPKSKCLAWATSLEISKKNSIGNIRKSLNQPSSQNLTVGSLTITSVNAIQQQKIKNQSEVILQSAASYSTNFDNSTLQVLPKKNVNSQDKLTMNYAEDCTQCALDSFSSNKGQHGKVSISKNLFHNINKHVTNSSTENKEPKRAGKPKKKLEQEKSSDVCKIIGGKELKTPSNRKRKIVNNNDAPSPTKKTMEIIDSPLEVSKKKSIKDLTIAKSSNLLSSNNLNVGSPTITPTQQQITKNQKQTQILQISSTEAIGKTLPEKSPLKRPEIVILDDRKITPISKQKPTQDSVNPIEKLQIKNKEAVKAKGSPILEELSLLIASTTKNKESTCENSELKVTPTTSRSPLTAANQASLSKGTARNRVNMENKKTDKALKSTPTSDRNQVENQALFSKTITKNKKTDEDEALTSTPTTSKKSTKETENQTKTPHSKMQATFKKTRQFGYGCPFVCSTTKIKHLKAKEAKQMQIKNLQELKRLFDTINSSRHLKGLLNFEEKQILLKFQNMEENHQYIIMKLYTRKKVWHNIFNFCEQINMCFTDEKEIVDIFHYLREEQFIEMNYYENQENMVELLKQLERSKLKQIMEELLRIKSNTKTKSEMIEHICKASNQQATLTSQKTFKDLVMEQIKNKLGRAVKMREAIETCFDNLYLLTTFTNNTFENIQDYFRHIINENIVFPTYSVEDYPVFYSRENFLNYARAMQLHKQLQDIFENIKEDKPIAIYNLANIIFRFLNSIDEDCTRDHGNAPHLKRFTASHLLSKLLFSCCTKIFSKQKGYPAEVKKWLEFLIKKFPYSKRQGKWYHKLIWIHMRHLDNVSYQTAAKLLIEVLANKQNYLDERIKYELGALGHSIKNSKKHKIDQIYYDQITELVPRLLDLEFPENHIDSQAIRSEIVGKKRMYKTKSDQELTISNVEQIALNEYKENGYPHGQHCEGSLIHNLLILYFWDIIYNPENIIPGIFISKLQNAPLDMFTEYFYKNRKIEIDQRLRQIEFQWSKNELLEFGMDNWVKHSHEFAVFGMVMTIIKEAAMVEDLVEVIGRKVLAKIFERLIKNLSQYKSGMPDLLIWNLKEKTHKFVEVKGENDRLAIHQTLWLKYLQEVGASVEVCYVHSMGSVRKKGNKKSADERNDVVD